MSNTKEISVCYVGIYEPTIARNSVYVRGLRKNGIKVFECVDASRGIKKYFRLAKKYKVVAGTTNIILVGYTSGVLVLLMRCISRKPIVYNAAHSLYEGIILDRMQHKAFSWKAIYYWLIDFLSFYLATVSLVESEQQANFISREFYVSKHKLKVFYTGADNQDFFPERNIIKHQNFTVVFRGGFLPATGVDYIIEAANLLKNENIYFQIYGRGMLEKEIRKKISDRGLSRINLETRFLDASDLRRQILSAHVMLGQFSSHERLDRTIQNKIFEALALGMPFITRSSASNREILTDGENCLFVEAEDPVSITVAIKKLKDNPSLRKDMGKKAHALYMDEFSPDVIGKDLAGLVKELAAK